MQTTPVSREMSLSRICRYSSLGMPKSATLTLDFRLKRNANFSMIAYKDHWRVTMKKCIPRISRPTGLDTKTWRYVEPIFNASQQAQRETGRFKSYGCLVAVYRTQKEWKDLGISKKMARHIAKSFKTPRRKGTSPVRTLIDVTSPALDAKQKSRWSRALEFAASTKATPEQLPNLFKNHSGIAGCARLATKQKTKKKTYKYDWAADPSRGGVVVQKKSKISAHWRL
jgi:hypothetical protein